MNVLDAFVRLDQEITDLQRDALQVGLKQTEIVRGHGGEQAVANRRLQRLGHDTLLLESTDAPLRC